MRKNTTILFCMVLLTALMAVSCDEGSDEPSYLDIHGVWDFEFMVGGYGYNGWFVIVQNDDVLTGDGIIYVSYGYDLYLSGTIDKNEKVTMHWTTPTSGVVDFDITCTATKTNMTGTISCSNFQNRPFNAFRATGGMVNDEDDDTQDIY